jgi:glucose 1-dehydrogenase
LVTGAGSGIGRAVALRLASEGADVCVNDVVGSTSAQQVAEMIVAQRRFAFAVAADVSDEGQVSAMFDDVGRRLGGPPDILVNNAGVQTSFALMDMPLREWERTLAVNLTGAFLCAREAARRLVDAGAPGTIVNVSSVHEHLAWPDHAHYCASKAGLKLFGQSIARELAPHQIRVVAVAPGTIETTMTAEVLANDEHREDLQRHIPWGRIGSPEDVAAAVAWLCGSDADYIVGSTVLIDGGLSLGQR